MNILFDWLLITVGTIIVLYSINAIIANKKSSTAHFIIVIEFVTCCLPILLNYLIGYPEYTTIYWYQTFRNSMQDASISIIYDIYIIFCLCALWLYAYQFDKYRTSSLSCEFMPWNSLLRNKTIVSIAVFSPFIYILVSGKAQFFLSFGVRTSRYAKENSMTEVVSALIMLSVYAFCCRLVATNKSKFKIPITILYVLAITWLQGKRFILAMLGIIILFLYTRKGLNQSEQRKLKIFLPIFGIAILMFSYWYLVFVRPLSNTSFMSVYDMLRVDFGRDDVIKYVIEKVIIHKQMIVPYPGSTFLSTFLFFIPRALWTNKPYPHYVYLTSSILNVPILEIPAGTTPSWLEMCVANFGILGFALGIISIPFFCYLADKIHITSYQLVAVVLIVALLTQNIDAYLIFVILFIVQFFIRSLFRNKRIIFTWRRRRI